MANPQREEIEMQLLRLTHWALLFVIAAMLSLAAAADTPDGGSQVVPSTEAENVEWSRSPTEVGERTGIQNVCISADESTTSGELELGDDALSELNGGSQICMCDQRFCCEGCQGCASSTGYCCEIATIGGACAAISQCDCLQC